MFVENNEHIIIHHQVMLMYRHTGLDLHMKQQQNVPNPWEYTRDSIWIQTELQGNMVCTK